MQLLKTVVLTRGSQTWTASNIWRADIYTGFIKKIAAFDIPIIQENFIQ